MATTSVIFKMALVVFLLNCTVWVHAQVPSISSFAPDIATRFDSVTITGLNFTGVTGVRFGDSAAFSFRIVSDTVLKAVVGSGGYGLVYVSNAIGTDTSANRFYYQSWYPKITSFTPTRGTDQTTITISGNQFIGTSAVTFGGRPADSFIVVSNTKILATVGLGNSGTVAVFNTGMRDTLNGFTYFVTPPTITSFSPALAAIKDTISITGFGFSPVIANNTVYFGGIKATITAATRTLLTVVVPSGAGYQPISVTYNRYTGYSKKPLIVRFPGASTNFSTTFFDVPFKIATAGTDPSRIAAADFDGDGKNDLAVVYGSFGTNNTTVSVYRNIASREHILFAAPVEYLASPQGYSGCDAGTADMDGDGKIDLIVTSTGDNRVGIFKNTSTPGTISFATRMDFVASNYNGGPESTSPTSMSVADFNVDGRPDIAFGNYGGGNWSRVSFLRNTSIDGVLSFAPRVDYPIISAWMISASQLNSDAKPDMAAVIFNGGSGANHIEPMVNTSLGDNIVLSTIGSVATSLGSIPVRTAFGDIDGDGKTDMVAAYSANGFAVYRNTTADTIYLTFAAPQPFLATSTTSSTLAKAVTVNDMDGDGKPDVLLTLAGDNKVVLFKNISTPTTVLFASPVPISCGLTPLDVLCDDLNGDGRPDIVTANSGEGTLSVIKNNVGGPLKLCAPLASFLLQANIGGTSYQWQVDTGNHIFTDLLNNSYYSGTTTATLLAGNIPTSFTGNQYRCVSNTTTNYPIKIQFENQWTGAANSLWKNAGNWSCGVVPDGNTDVVIRTGYVILNSNGICRSLTVLPEATFKIFAGYSLTLTR